MPKDPVTEDIAKLLTALFPTADNVSFHPMLRTVILEGSFSLEELKSLVVLLEMMLRRYEDDERARRAGLKPGGPAPDKD